ncbi:glycoside hydrolase family 25 domain-containing protein [Nocardioides acrostichi]|uniref:Uncharacterized protein n=1 Tax=Nocardioides acrostichi TaxID=2784339 RepID=A0A930YB93_9ACTN|nr:hypothetical protein [Nocardioides acrostichi]MBF4162218.1 hypothetical protein [Nocardioides acrostichi]
MRGRWLAGALLGCLLVTGCSGGADDDPSGGESAAAPRASSGATAKPTPEAFPNAGKGAGKVSDDGLTLTDVQREQMENLADLAEKAAGEQSRIPARDGAPVLGSDFSWPQCPKGMGIPQKRSMGLPGPLPAAEYAVIGLTNGPGFFPNPCLADQAALASSQGLMTAAYAVVSYPDSDTLSRFGDDGPFDGGDRLGALKNVGYQQALYNVRSMRAAGLASPIVWIDVEPVKFFEWSGDEAANAAVVEGTRRGYTDLGYEVGVYSTPYLYSQIVGGFAMRVPEWRAAGPTSRAAALSKCSGESIQGGVPVMGQWVEQGRDQNLTCPGISRDLGRYFAPPG